MKIRPYLDGDEAGILNLDRAVEEHPWNRRDLSNWVWKYRGPNPAGSPLIYVAENDGEIVAHFAIMPMRYRIDGQTVLGSHSLAMMVTPAWQNRGLIKFVADKLLADAVEAGLAFTYGYPNDNAYDLHLKLLGYEDVCRQQLWQRELASGEASKGEAPNIGLDWREITVFSAEAEALFSRTEPRLGAAVLRDAAFLNWRYLARPDVRYFAFGAYRGAELAGYCVLKLYQEGSLLRGHFLDILAVADDDEAGGFLLDMGLDFFRSKGCGEVNLWMQGSPFICGLLARRDFRTVSSRPFICRFNRDKGYFQPRLTDKNWYFTMGDTFEIY